MSPPRFLQRSILASLCTAVACDDPGRAPPPASAGPIGKADGAEEGVSGRDIDGLQVELDPEELAAFSFCYDTEPSDDPDDAFGANLINARWLGFLAANQYAYFSNLTEALVAMGFGDPDDHAHWQLFADSLDDAWEREQFGQYEPGFVDEMIHHKLQRVEPGRKIQFFTGGRFDETRGTFDDGTTQMLWIEHRELPLVIVAFRGTEASGRKDDARVQDDILTDLRIFQVHHLNDEAGQGLAEWGYVHAGFQRGFEEIEALLLDKLWTDGQGKHVFVTGHSLGGALATLATSRILFETTRHGGAVPWTLEGLYTFGSPRVGNVPYRDNLEALARAHGVTLARVRHADDIVTQIPDLAPPGLDPLLPFGARYTHVGHQLFLRYNGELWYRERDDELGIPGYDNPLGVWENATAWDSSLGDHSMAQYYARLEAHADEYARFTDCPR